MLVKNTKEWQTLKYFPQSTTLTLMRCYNYPQQAQFWRGFVGISLSVHLSVHMSFKHNSTLIVNIRWTDTDETLYSMIQEDTLDPSYCKG